MPKSPKWYFCEFCEKIYPKAREAVRCRRRGLIVPRFKVGERVKVRFGKRRFVYGIIQVDWDYDDLMDPHSYDSESYFVKIDGQEDKFARAAPKDILGVIQNNGWLIKRKRPKKVKTWKERTRKEKALGFIRP